MEEFIQNMPKIELHAHLNGSLTTEALLELGAMKYGSTNDVFEDLVKSFHLTEDSLTECFKKFKIAHYLTDTKETLEHATICAIRDFAKDNVVYIELRTTLKQNECMSKEDYLKCVLNAIRTAKKIYPKTLVKLLPSIDRSQGLESAKTTADIVLKLHREFEDIIKGIDLSGNPSAGHFATYKPILERFRKLNLHLAFHCGEVENDDEIEEMLDFGMSRCGHGTFIKGENLEKLIDKGIPVECCLSSNILCATVPTYDDHHFKNFLKNQHPVVLCTDDFGVFNTTLSKEFMIAQKTFQLTTEDLCCLTKTAVMKSFASNKEKIQLMKTVEEYFNM